MQGEWWWRKCVSMCVCVCIYVCVKGEGGFDAMQTGCTNAARCHECSIGYTTKTRTFVCQHWRKICFGGELVQ